MGVEDADFSGYASKADLECSDGRTIMKDAFAHQDKDVVPLVWQHSHDTPMNVLGKAYLEHREDGMYAYAFFNNSKEAQKSKELVEHGDVVSLSIYANRLQERSKKVFHGVIREVSLVLSGANPGALIDQVRLAHGDDFVTLDDEAVIYTGLPIEHREESSAVEHADVKKNIADIFKTFTDEQALAVEIVLESALEEQAASMKHSDTDESSSSDENSATKSEDEDSDDENTSEDAESTDDGKNSEDVTSEDDSKKSEDSDSNDKSTDAKSEDTTEGNLAHMEGSTTMSRNVFDTNDATGSKTKTLSHSAFADLMKDAKNRGSFKEALQHSLQNKQLDEFLAHATNEAGDTVEYGIADIEFLFPEAKLDAAGLQVYSRRQEWVKSVLDNVKKLPFSKVRTLIADITDDEARAKGYVKGTRKKEEVIKLLRRSTGPATIYKKQKLDRDDVIDIGNDIDIIAWLKVEIRLMLEEELARAILIGDGRSDANEDRIKDPEGALAGEGIRSIYHDDDFYAIKVPLHANATVREVVKELVRARAKWRGTGKPSLFIAGNQLTEIMLEEDKFGRSLYANIQEVADKLRVSEIVEVEVFNELDDLFGIMVNLVDYSVGTNKGGELTSFEDFDIDFNQHKYLQETRLSGGLNKPLSAVVVLREEGTSVTPTAPSFNGTTNTITIPSVTGVVYEGNDEPLSSGAHVIDETTEVVAHADEGYYIPAGTTTSWTYTYTP